MYIKRKGRKKKRSHITPLQIVALRKKMKCTPKELAHILGVNIRTVQDWERGKRSPCGLARAFLFFLKNKSREELRSIVTEIDIADFLKKNKEPLRVYFTPPFNQIDKKKGA